MMKQQVGFYAVSPHFLNRNYIIRGGEHMEKKKKERGHYIFRKYIRNAKTGEIICASKYGKKAFKIWVKD